MSGPSWTAPLLAPLADGSLERADRDVLGSRSDRPLLARRGSRAVAPPAGRGRGGGSPRGGGGAGGGGKYAGGRGAPQRAGWPAAARGGPRRQRAYSVPRAGW